MYEKFNKQVFDSFPNTVWDGEMPDFDSRRTKKKPFAKTVRVITNLAAIMSIPLAAAVWIISARSPKPDTSFEPLAQSEVVYTVNNATRADIVLPDSTLVTLNSGSTLKLDSNFGSGTRKVTLDGEAYFDVHHDKGLPFEVFTPQDVKVKVTGTKFNVSCYADNPKFDLTLIQGSVEVTGRNNEIIELRPSEQLLMKDGYFNVSKVESPEKALVWTEGTLMFDHTPMREAISRIEKWYGVRIAVSDEAVYNNSISAEFHSETMNEVIRLICISSRLDYSIRDNTVTLKSRNI